MRQKGFTLIEVMVVMGIMTIFGTLSIVAFNNYNQAQILKNTTNELVATLNLARSRAQSQVRLWNKLTDSCHDTANPLEGYQVLLSNDGTNVIYELDSVCGGAATVLKTKVISAKDVTVPGEDVNPNGNTFYFPVLTGQLTPNNNNNYDIELQAGGVTKTINIDRATGRISVDP